MEIEFNTAESLQTTLDNLQGQTGFVLNALSGMESRNESVYLPDLIGIVASIFDQAARAAYLSKNLFEENNCD